jgi:hypothetical protein
MSFSILKQFLATVLFSFPRTFSDYQIFTVFANMYSDGGDICHYVHIVYIQYNVNVNKILIYFLTSRNLQQQEMSRVDCALRHQGRLGQVA